MKDCKGLIGKCFGHDFVRYLIKSKADGADIETKNEVIAKYFIDNLSDLYEVRCRRCGYKPPKENNE